MRNPLQTLLMCVVFLVVYTTPISAKNLNNYVPVLESVKQQAFKVDPKKGYLVEKVKPNVYIITDGIWQSAFVTTGEGVIVIDAPQSFAKHLLPAIKETTKQPIKLLIYSHSHTDHIGGSAMLADKTPGLRILAHQSISKLLAQKKDPRRVIPTETYAENHVVKMGSEEIQLNLHGNYHSRESDVFIFLPKHKFLMVIDSITPGYAPFMSFSLTSNFHEYLHMFDDILAYDFDVFVGGHLSQVGTKDDVRVSQAYTKDVYETVKRVHANTDEFRIMADTAKVIGWDNKYLLFKTFLDHVIAKSAREIEKRWIDKLAGVDVWSESHARTALIYVRWDD